MINGLDFNKYNSNYILSQGQSAAQSPQKQSPLPLYKKAVILGTSVAGAAPVVAFWAKRAGFSLNPKKIMNTKIKDWALFKYEPKSKCINYKVPQVLSVATGSVAGGFIGGAIVDKENLKSKKREVLSQMFGNITVPILTVGAGAELFNKYVSRMQNAMPQINKNSGMAKAANKCLQNIPNIVSTATFLGLGIWAGNRVSNFINDKIYHKKVERNIRATDFAPHIDDVCVATSMMNEGSKFASILGRVIPFALLVPGYETGTAREE